MEAIDWKKIFAIPESGKWYWKYIKNSYVLVSKHPWEKRVHIEAMYETQFLEQVSCLGDTHSYWRPRRCRFKQ